HVDEWQHRDRRPVGRGQSRARGYHFAAKLRAIDLDWPGDVLEPMLPHIFEGKVELPARILLDSGGDADATGLSKSLEARRHVHAVPIDIAAFDHDVADIDADAKCDPLFRLDLATVLNHVALDCDGAAQSVDHARELRQQPVTGGLHDPPSVFVDFGVKQVSPKRSQPSERALLIGAYQPAVADHVGGHDGSKTTLGAFLGHVMLLPSENAE